MKTQVQLVSFILFLMVSAIPRQGLSQTQDNAVTANSGGWFSLGGRSTLSAFSHDGSGIGTGGQFRIRLNSSVNTDWFADYIVINEDERIRSTYYHIGWSVLYYPFKDLIYPDHLVQPYVLAGHCFDYNEKTLMAMPVISKGRWGSAVQAGLGTHFNITDRFDVSLMAQYMIHLTEEIEFDHKTNTFNSAHNHKSSLEGHLLGTISINYKLFRLWRP